MANSLPEVPMAFKPIQHYLKTAAEYEKRDPVVSYYCEYLVSTSVNQQKGLDFQSAFL